MRAGRLIQAGTAEDLYHRPADLFVARLFSEINEIPWTVTGGALRTPVGTFMVPEIGEGDRAVLCIRQRAIGLAKAGEGIAARLVRVKPLGDAALVDLAVEGFEGLLRARVRESELPRTPDIGVLIAPERVLVFPADESEPASTLDESP
jgi:iron(III) transport system ATP-binding protein